MMDVNENAADLGSLQTNGSPRGQLSQTGSSDTLPYMENPTTRPKLLEQLEALTTERFPEGLAVRLQRKFGVKGLDADAAVGDAIEIMVKKADTLQVEDARAYLTAIATNLLRRASKRQVLLSLDERDDVGDESVEDEALRTEVFKYVKTLVQRWENASLRETALLIIDAAFLGEILTTEELAALLEDILGEEVSLSTVRKWKERSLDRLAEELRDQGFID
jgi:DNA-directed RNA polymerase specialized sigma24 family protein